jgi:hypothetical protein
VKPGNAPTKIVLTASKTSLLTQHPYLLPVAELERKQWAGHRKVEHNSFIPNQTSLQISFLYKKGAPLIKQTGI